MIVKLKKSVILHFQHLEKDYKAVAKATALPRIKATATLFAVAPSRRNIIVQDRYCKAGTYYLSFPWIQFLHLHHFNSSTYVLFSKDLEGSAVWTVPLPNIRRDTCSLCLGEYKFPTLEEELIEFTVKSFFGFKFINEGGLRDRSIDKIQEWQRKTKENKNWIPGDDFFEPFVSPYLARI